MLLVRHGQTTWNAERRWQGHADAPLSNLGRLQAAEAARAIGAVDAVAASDLSRAAETAAIVSAALGVGPVMVDARMRERDVGEWEGLTRAEIEERDPGAIDAWRTPPGFEHDDVVAERATAALMALHAEMPGGAAVVVTHGGVIRALVRTSGGADEWVPNLGGRWFDVRGNGDAPELRLGDAVQLIDHDTVAALHEASEQDLG
jgi:broad specificity phosphatase PhoE